jgi:hypothetical protein
MSESDLTGYEVDEYLSQITNNNINSIDEYLGHIQEVMNKPRIENALDCELISLSKYDCFDFINKEKKIIVELKSRNNDKNKYTTTIVGDNKFKKAKEYFDDGYKVYFFFKFYDTLSYYIYNPNDDILKTKGGRNDRGRPEIKLYRYIPIFKLIDV